MKLFTYITLLLTCLRIGSYAQSPVLLSDLARGTNGSYPSNFTYYANLTFFTAYTIETGSELWIWNGTNVVLSTNINSTVTNDAFGNTIGNDSAPDSLTLFNGALYFSAFDPRRGGELWRYQNGVATRVADINPDANDTIKFNPRSSWPHEILVYNNALYFSADSGGIFQDYELWKFDGATASRVANIRQSTDGTNSSSYPRWLSVFNGYLFFMADDGQNGFELWRRDGTNTIMLTNINPGVASSFPKNFTEAKGYLYFQALNDSTGFELWKTDGTNVLLAADINSGPASSFPEHLTTYLGSLYFSAEGPSGFQLWKYDGTNATVAAEINPLADSFPRNLRTFQDRLYFSATDGSSGWELWSYNGASATLVTNLNTTADAFPEQLTVVGDSLYFAATTPATGYEIWKYDGSAVSQATDISTGPADSFPLHLTAIQSNLFFSATSDGGSSNWEPWMIVGEITRPDPDPPTFLSISNESGHVLLQLAAPANTPHVLETSHDLLSWSPISTNTPTAGQLQFQHDPAGLNTFYRVRVP